jgi:hypothetical protein
MKKTMSFIYLCLLVGSSAEAGPLASRDVYADTWVAQDAVGRKMPSFSEAGPVKTGQ